MGIKPGFLWMGLVSFQGSHHGDKALVVGSGIRACQGGWLNLACVQGFDGQPCLAHFREPHANPSSKYCSFSFLPNNREILLGAWDSLPFSNNSIFTRKIAFPP